MAVIVIKMAAAVIVVFVMAVVISPIVAVVIVAVEIVLALAVMMPVIVTDVVSISASVVPAVVRPRVRATDPVTAIVGAAIGPDETVVSPSVGVAPIGPGADAEEDSVIEVTRPVESRRGAGVRRELVIAVGADGRCADLDAEGDLGIGLGRESKNRKRQGRAEKREESAPEEGFSFRNLAFKDTF
jgi:hypothetical protein